MAGRKPPLFDRAFAGLVFDRLSAACVRHPDTLGKWVMGDHPVRWHATGTHAEDVPAWYKFEADETAGFRPVTFTKGVRLTVPVGDLAKALSALEREHGGRALPAAASTVGAVVVAAEIPPYGGNQLRMPEELRGQRAAILGLGGGTLYATLGAYHPEANVFMGAENVDVTEPAPDRLQSLAVLYPATPKL
ncbi:MAG TPA: hypothetical protein VLH86_06410 [Patescibacteria group bacterium]|nr:hypothetical protein [Patescibacteria group bacterium]